MSVAGSESSPPTDYGDEKGKLLLRTNDGSNAVITVPKRRSFKVRQTVVISVWIANHGTLR